MADQRLDRRQILKGAGALGATGVLATMQAPGQAHAEKDERPAQGLVGSWRVTATDAATGAFRFHALHSYAHSGVFIGTRMGSTTGQQPTGTAHGTWTQIGEDKFAATFFELLTDTGGTFAGTTKVRERLTLDKDGGGFSGSSLFEVHDAKGALVFSGSHKERAIHIPVEYL